MGTVIRVLSNVHFLTEEECDIDEHGNPEVEGRDVWHIDNQFSELLHNQYGEGKGKDFIVGDEQLATRAMLYDYAREGIAEVCGYPKTDYQGFGRIPSGSSHAYGAWQFADTPERYEHLAIDLIAFTNGPGIMSPECCKRIYKDLTLIKNDFYNKWGSRREMTQAFDNIYFIYQTANNCAGWVLYS